MGHKAGSPEESRPGGQVAVAGGADASQKTILWDLAMNTSLGTSKKAMGILQ